MNLFHLFKHKQKNLELPLDLMHEDFIQDPYRYFDHLRTHEPIHRCKSGAWVITRHSDILSIINDKRFGNSPSPFSVLNQKNAEKYICASAANNIIAFMDAPKHHEYRRIIAKTFSEHLKNAQPNFTELAKNLLAPLKSRQEFELIQDFSTPFAIDSMTKIIGLPSNNNDQIKAWSSHLIYLFTYIPSEKIRQNIDSHIQTFRTYCIDLIKNASYNKSSWLAEACEYRNTHNVDISDIELADNCLLLLADGIENIERGIASTLALLLKHPKQYSSLKKGKATLQQTIDESLRYESPAQFIGRIALEDTTINEVTIKKGQTILLMLSSANRDSTVYKNANSFDIHRPKQPSLSFGKGHHSCVGSHLAKLQINHALASIIEELPTISMPNKDLTWEFRLGHRWLSELNLQNIG